MALLEYILVAPPILQAVALAVALAAALAVAVALVVALEVALAVDHCLNLLTKERSVM